MKENYSGYRSVESSVPCVLRRANEEIAQVRTKAASEGVALGAGLRKEQMKVDSLERAVQQKV